MYGHEPDRKSTLHHRGNSFKMLDLSIRGGTVVDGTGAPARRADIGVSGNRIVSITDPGDIGPASRVIDAEGLTVSPGFVDIHTHLDAQVFWDPACTPLPLYGVTTAVGGNCGFTLAPAIPEERDYLTRLLAKVEEIPIEALRAGLPWSWSSTKEFLERVEECGPAINLGFLVGHSAVRRVVMGKRAVRDEATADDLEQMSELLRRSLAEGGIGFSSSWYGGHADEDGVPVPSRLASADEIVELCRVTGTVPGTQIAFAPDLRGQRSFDQERIDLFVRMSAAAKRPVNWNLFSLAFSDREMAYSQLAASDEVAAAGGRLVALSYPGVMTQRREFFGHWYTAFPGWADHADCTADQKVALLRDPEQRRRLADAADAARQGGLDRHGITRWDDLVIAETFSAGNAPYEGHRLGDIAREEGRDAFDVLCDIAITDGMRTGLTPPGKGADEESWKIRVETWSDPRVVLGASDSGAHLQSLSTFDWTAELLSQNRVRGVMPLERIVQRMTQAPAELYGIRDRGTLTEGAYADVAVFDSTTFGPGPVRWVEDLPTGAGRVCGAAVGLSHVLVNGTAVVEDGKLTDARSGTVMRSGIDTYTVEP